MTTLLIVESPAKAKKIKGFYRDKPIQVKSSFGHIYDLDKKTLFNYVLILILTYVIIGKLNYYKGSTGSKIFSVSMETYLNKEVASRDSKGNPKTYRINLGSNVSIKDSNGNINKKLFSKSVDYNNKSNKSELKKYENETSKNLAEQISDEIIIYLQSI